MSNCYFVFSLPFLHVELAGKLNNPVLLSDTIKHIWPGLPNMPKDFYWTSSDYVFDSVTAEHCMKNLDAMGLAAMTGVPVHSLVMMDKDIKENKKRQEMNDLRSFAQDGLMPSAPSDLSSQHAVDSAIVFEAAQKILLWSWLLEEKVLEISNLMNKYKEQISSTTDPLFVEEESSMNTLLDIEYQIEDGDAPLPSWKLILENAAVFLPDNSIIFVNCKQMMSDLEEILDFQAATADTLKICAENFNDKYDVFQSKSFVGEALVKKNRDNKHCGLDKSFTFVILRGLNE